MRLPSRCVEHAVRFVDVVGDDEQRGVAEGFGLQRFGVFEELPGR